MKVRAPLAIAAVLLAAGTLAGAEETKAYKVRFDDVWKVGDTVTRQSSETETTNVVVKMGEQVLNEQKGTTTTTFRLVEKCLAAEGGKSTKRLLHFASWSTSGTGKEGDIKDETLAGTHVEVTGQGEKRAWKMLTTGKEIGDLARAWLEKKFGPGGSEGDTALAPKEPVAPGATWNPDPAEIAKGMGKGNLDVDVAKSTIKVTFVDVKTTKAGEFGHFLLEMNLATKALQSPMGAMPWKEGGLFAAKGNMMRGLEEGSFDEERSMALTLAGVAEAGQGVLVNIEFKATGQEAVGRGGEMPPAPEPAAGGAAPAPAPAPTMPK